MQGRVVILHASNCITEPNGKMATARKSTILLLVTALVLLWSFHAQGELIKLRAEGRIHKVDVTESADLGIEVGATFLFELSYDTDEKGTIRVRGLTIDSVEQLLKQETYFVKVNHASNVGSWDRLRLTVKRGSGTGATSFNAKVVLDSIVDTADAQPHYLPINGLTISLGSETFFHLVYSDTQVQRGPSELISGEITSLTRVDG